MQYALLRTSALALAFAASAGLAAAQQQPPPADAQQQSQQEKAQQTPSGQMGKEEPSSHAPSAAPPANAVLVNGALAVPDAPATDMVPAKFSAKNFQRQCALAGFLEQELGDAAHAVAAGARFRSIVIVDADIAIGAWRARCVERHQLVVWRSVGLRGGARLSRADCSRLPAHVDHHDLVAETVHFDEGMVGERAHGRPVAAALYGQIGR